MEKEVSIASERQALAKVGAETLQILEDFKYQSSLGQKISIKSPLKKAIKNTILYSPGDLLNLNKPTNSQNTFPVIEITNETTSAAGKRLIENNKDVVVLNFASAKTPGGGFLNGARAQEEDLTRKSGLFACLKSQPKYYLANKKCNSCLYTDYLIYSPNVPFFRDENLSLLDEPYLLSVITSPAPNVGAQLQREANIDKKIQTVVESRSRDILFAAKQHHHRNLVLGAWGCGIFRNDPKLVAQAFLKNLKHVWFSGSFDHIVFAIYEFSTEKILTKVFQEVLCGK